MFGLVTGWRGYAVAAVGGTAVVIGILWYGHEKYEQGRVSAMAEYHAAELAVWRQEADRLISLSNALETGLVALRDAKPKIIERYTRVETQVPLPDGCRIDGERLQSINEAINAANAASQPGDALSAYTAR